MSVMSEEQRNYYIATAIPYVNDKPHIGHAVLHLYADVLARYHRQQGDDVLYSAGTDEHGGKIEEAAQKAGVPTQKLVDEFSASFSEGLAELGISYDSFIRTTDKDHKKRAAIIWKELEHDIYKNKYVGMYCTGCEEFKTPGYVKETGGVCPLHNRPYEKIEEENYFFRLSAYNDRIRDAIESGAFEITPKARKNEILGLLKEGLEDISISRSSESVSWGVPVPGDSSQVMYVWFEALMNYITTLGYPEGDKFKKFWPANVQVIGKDILRFHAAIWPGMLLSLGLPLPSRLFVHGFISSNGQKMSKSLGNVVDPLEVARTYGVDAFRYYFLRHGPINDDVDFTWDKFITAYNGELANELGNAVSRVAAMVMKYQNGIIGAESFGGHDIGRYIGALDDCRFDTALEEVWAQITGVNQYIEEQKPWEIAKKGETDHLQGVLSYLCGALLEIADMLVPFMPETAQKITDVFSGEKVTPTDGPLFPRIDTEA